MARNNSRRRDDQDQEQDQDQKQAELQAQLQAQLQGQGQGQLQGQGQGQGQAQAQAQFALNGNANLNGNGNYSENDNENKNENKNENSNELKNEVDNEVENSVDNEVDNDIKNSVENHVENKVDVAVDVKIDLDLTSLPDDQDVIDIDSIHHIYGSVVMPDVVTQDLRGDGNQINIDQVNNIVDNDFLWDPDVSYRSGHGDFKQDAWADGGHVKLDDPRVDIDADGGAVGDTLTSTADGVASNEAFTQNIVMGANIQFNSIEMAVAGDDLTDDHSI